MQVSSVVPTASSAADATAGTAVRAIKKSLGQDDFLRLLSKQFEVQDPLKPIEDTAFIAQMAQFSALEQSNALVQQLVQLRAGQDVVTANSFIGRRVTLDAGHGQTAVGEVTGVTLTNGAPRLVVGGTTYSLSAVLNVAPGVPPAPVSPVSPAGGV